MRSSRASSDRASVHSSSLKRLLKIVKYSISVSTKEHCSTRAAVIRMVTLCRFVFSNLNIAPRTPGAKRICWPETARTTIPRILKVKSGDNANSAAKFVASWKRRAIPKLWPFSSTKRLRDAFARRIASSSQNFAYSISARSRTITIPVDAFELPIPSKLCVWFRTALANTPN